MSTSLFEYLFDSGSIKLIDAKHDKDYVVTVNEVEKLTLQIPNINSKRSLVFYYSEFDSIESFLTYFAFLKSNNAIALFGSNMNEDLKLGLEREYNPKFIYDVSRNSITDFNAIDSDNLQGLFQNLKDNSDVEIDSNIKILLSTSGTTGSPKLVKLSDKNFISNSESILNYLPITSKDVTPINLSVYYSYGMSVFNSNAHAGGTLVYNCGDMLSKEFWINLSRYSFTSFSGVPYMYEMLSRIGFLKKEYPSLRYMTQAGGRLSDGLIQQFNLYTQQHHINLFIMYGQTEATARMSFVPYDNLSHKIGSIGIPVMNGIFEIDEVTSELVYKGPNVFGGYSTCQKDLQVWEKIKSLYTGDIARKDDEGYYFIIGRSKRFAKLYGYRVNLDEIETMVKKELSIAQIVCLSSNDESLEFYTTEDNLSVGSIQEIVSVKYKLPPSIIKLNYLLDFPLTPNGKIDYKAL